MTLQEANAIAVIDLNSLQVSGIYSAGYEDYSVIPVDIDKKDEVVNPKTYGSLRGSACRTASRFTLRTVQTIL